MMFPYLAARVTAVAVFSPRNVLSSVLWSIIIPSTFPPAAAHQDFLTFAKQSLSSWRWLKHNLKYRRTQSWQGNGKKERTQILCRSPKPLWCTDFKNFKGIFHSTSNLQAWRAFNTLTHWFESICISYCQKNRLAFPVLSLTQAGCQLCISFPDLNHSAWNNPAGWLPGLGWVGCYYS